MKELMLVLSFVIGYPLFMVFTFLLKRVIFPSTDKVAAEQQRDKQKLLIKAKRVRKHVPFDTRIILAQ